MERLAQLLNDHQTGMSEFQDKYFVTGRSGGTLYGQYKQALREVYKRFRGLRQQTSDHKRLLIDIDEANWKMENEENEFARRRAEVDFSEKTMLLEESERAIKDTKREFLNFYRQAVWLKEQVGELTEEKRNRLDTEMWLFKIKEMAVIDFVSNGRLRNSTFEFLHSLPLELKQTAVEEIKDNRKLINWYENKEEVVLPKELPKVEINFEALENLKCDNILPM